MQRLAVLGLLLSLSGACVAQAEEDYDLPADQYAPLDDKTDGDARPLRLSDSPRGELSYGDASWMASLSALSYQEPAQFIPTLQTFAPDAQVSWWKDVNAFVYYIETPTAGILVFRGTDGPIDWAVNLDASPEWTVYGYAHKGFWGDTYELLEKKTPESGGPGAGKVLRDYLAERHVDHPERPLYLTGHSLGGAMATLSYVMLELDGCRSFKQLPSDYQLCAHQGGDDDGWWIPVHALYTFGAPRAMDKNFAKLAGSPLIGDGKSPVFRFVNRGDLVPGVVGSLLYSHPRDGRQGEAGELPYLIHMGTGGIKRGAYEGTYPTTIADHSIRQYLIGIVTGKSGPSPR